MGPEPQLLTTLFGDPNQYCLRVFRRRFPGSSVVDIGWTYYLGRAFCVCIQLFSILDKL